MEPLSKARRKLHKRSGWISNSFIFDYRSCLRVLLLAETGVHHRENFNCLYVSKNLVETKKMSRTTVSEARWLQKFSTDEFSKKKTVKTSRCRVKKGGFHSDKRTAKKILRKGKKRRQTTTTKRNIATNRWKLADFPVRGDRESSVGSKQRVTSAAIRGMRRSRSGASYWDEQRPASK